MSYSSMKHGEKAISAFLETGFLKPWLNISSLNLMLFNSNENSYSPGLILDPDEKDRTNDE